MEKGSGGGVGGHMSEEDGDDAVCTATKLQAIPGYCLWLSEGQNISMAFASCDEAFSRKLALAFDLKSSPQFVRSNRRGLC